MKKLAHQGTKHMAGIFIPPCSVIADQIPVIFLGIYLGFSILFGACAASPEQEVEVLTEQPTLELSPTNQEQIPLLTGPPSSDQITRQGSFIRQWGSEAAATTEYADPEWSAENATGAPDTHLCGDYQTAYASSASDGIDTLAITYSVPVYATSLNIIQSFNPNQVVEVELIGIDGERFLVYSTPPVQIDQPCPFTLSMSFERTPVKVEAVHLKIDQSVLGLGWNEIDAVELVGETQ
jgi:hypothetical protein